ncbi:pyrimidine pathway regulatory 1 [Trichoderma arundinaceum]|uniref:Pyrimidine pathway regulatory 1 n=1 Tax=Trichoderma arundinaceum TaxID=490622 RepID=A0A395NQP1_TRIAR|nr:pyrimidine pathway regulatory 1 [Trichoderma arundinaceum]
MNHLFTHTLHNHQQVTGQLMSYHQAIALGYYPVGIPTNDQGNMGMINEPPNCLLMRAQSPNPAMVRPYNGTPESSSSSSAILFDSNNYDNNNGYGNFSAANGPNVFPSSNAFSGPRAFSGPNGPGYYYGSNGPNDLYGTNGTNYFYGNNGTNGFYSNHGHNAFYGPNSLNGSHVSNGYTGFNGHNGHNGLVMPFNSITASSYYFPNYQQVTSVQQIVLDQQLAAGHAQAAASTSSGSTTSERSSSMRSTRSTSKRNTKSASTRATRSGTKRRADSSSERVTKRRRVSTTERSEGNSSTAIIQYSEANTDRAEVACNCCQTRKIKCDLGDPDAEGCKACLRRGQPCIFFDRLVGRDLPRQYLRTLENHFTSLINYSIEIRDYMNQHGLVHQRPEALQDSLAFFDRHGIGGRDAQNQQAEQNAQTQSQ